MDTRIIFSNDIIDNLNLLIAEIKPSKIFVLTDNFSRQHTLKYFSDNLIFQSAIHITIESGENHKDINSLSEIWQALIDNKADRHAVLINIGGGVISDIGGFAAATYKRGIKYINVPTTILSAIDASIGGKTAINHQNIKNAIGAIHPPFATIISTRFFKTLSHDDILSGLGEMLKHALLKDLKSTSDILNSDIDSIYRDEFMDILRDSVMVKEAIVAEDPYENGIRKALNFGHTFGHAFESLSLSKNHIIPHGVAVAYGIVVELVLSHLVLQFPSQVLHQISSYVKDNFGSLPITCNDYDLLIDFMRQDKKNADSEINFTLMKSVGTPIIDCHSSVEQIKTALDIFRDLNQ